jgi:hypothetical protein
MRRVLASVLSLSLALSSFTPAFASEADAKDFFSRGRELRAKGDCAGAAPLFRKAWELYPQGLGSLRNLAECEEQLGHYASSRRAWLDLKRALIVSKDSKYDGWDTDADAAATRLAPKVARLTITIKQHTPDGEGPLTDTGVKVLINGEPLDRKLLDVALDRDPGSYKIRIEGGKSPVEKEINLNAGDNKPVTMTVELEGPPKNDPPPPPPKDDDVVKPPPPPPDTPKSSGTTKIVGYSLIGLGAASAVGAGVFFFLRQGALKDLETACPAYESGRCVGNASAANDAISRGKTASTLTTIFGGLAIVGIGAGIVILATAPSSEAPKTSVRLSPWAGAGGGGAFLTGEF